MVAHKKKLAIITCCLDDWGGSEELWAKSVPELLKHGLSDITIYKNEINKQHPEFIKLTDTNIHLKELWPQNSLARTVYLKLTDLIYQFGAKLKITPYQPNRVASQLAKFLRKNRPDFAVISQGINFDGLAFAYECLKLKIPYIIVCHKAVDFYWPDQRDRDFMRETLLKAAKCLFVSKHNLKLTEEQFGIRLPNSSVVINPVKVEVHPQPYPEVSNGFKLACIGRLFVIDKGQDVLLRILDQPKWRARNISVSFIGKGPDQEGIMEMAKLLNVQNISFGGFNGDLNEIWKHHHALILPSRSEGLPLTIIEAMSLGRVSIVTNAGGNAEVLEEGETGFIGECNEKDFEEAMERAWQKRDGWELMGKKSAEYIRKTIPKKPEKIFADLINEAIKATD
ncbi:group 1 glycosyl transferase [Pedobacter yonginense]|uniref:Group 1 glycosyl transferase n=1 Tax=Pedobacter yonginense TaxID=651869 RepID=A0A317ER90_9SPHI|nr:glycosyltransferase family 4 protein [Pedobacter yonginense]PWS29204.1 group 1 glycosyl transferase [Pedobacter yonginense]